MVHKCFTIEVIQHFCKRIKNLEYEDFNKMYQEIGFDDKKYIQDQYAIKGANFVEWFCNVPESKMRDMLEYLDYKKYVESINDYEDDYTLGTSMGFNK